VSEPSHLSTFRDLVRDFLAWSNRQMTEPDADWPVCMLWMENAEHQVDVMEVPGQLFATGVMKDAVARVIKMVMKSSDAVRYVLVMNVHGLFLDRTDEENEEVMQRVQDEEVRIQQLPGAKEALMMIWGDAEEEHQGIALISRHDDRPPELGEWDDEKAERVEGRFSGLNRALR